jgi:hypothetical protein
MERDSVFLFNNDFDDGVSSPGCPWNTRRSATAGGPRSSIALKNLIQLSLNEDEKQFIVSRCEH